MVAIFGTENNPWPGLVRFRERAYLRVDTRRLCLLPYLLNLDGREGSLGHCPMRTGLIGRLAGEGGRLPNPHILIRPFVRREAVLSSRIEGTQATLGELLAAEAGAPVDRNPEDLREVGNYVVALEHGISHLKKLPLSVRLTRELHEKLMTGVRGHHATPGRFRTVQNWIGKPGSTAATASYIPPPRER